MNTNRPASSVSSSPSGTGTSWNSPASSGTGGAPTPVIVRGPEATTRRSRPAPVTSALRRLTGPAAGMSIAVLKSYQAAFLLATLTVHAIVPSAAVSSLTTSPWSS